jgi:sugar-specific transcriptional regulator TrmB
MSEREADLMEFGLTVLQSKAYLTLLRLGSMRAGQLSSATGIVRPEIYRILRELSSQGLVQRTPGVPSIYAAASPEKGLSLIIDRQRRRLSELERKKAALVKAFARHPHDGEGVIDGRFGVIMGADNVVSKAKQMIADTKYEYAAIMSEYALKRAREDGVTRVLASAHKRDVRIRIISEIDESNSPIANNIAKYVELRRSSALLFYVDIFDEKEMLFGPAITDAELGDTVRKDIDFWTNNPQFVRGMQALFEHLWDASSKYEPRR